MVLKGFEPHLSVPFCGVIHACCFCRVRDLIPTSKDVEPLLEIDRDERKFEVFLSFHKASLHVSDLKVFLPFTINLDPYIRKTIRGE